VAYEKKNVTNDADQIGVVTVALEENNGHAGTNHRIHEKLCRRKWDTPAAARRCEGRCVCVGVRASGSLQLG
jgi:hypothetical protein